MRMVIGLDPDGRVRGQNIIPGGQSGLKDSPHSVDQLAEWLGNRAYPLRFHAEEVLEYAGKRSLCASALSEVFMMSSWCAIGWVMTLLIFGLGCRDVDDDQQIASRDSGVHASHGWGLISSRCASGCGKRRRICLRSPMNLGDRSSQKYRVSQPTTTFKRL